MSLLQRIDRLETSLGGQPCPECGGWPGCPVSFVLDSPDGEGPAGPERCPRCRRVLHFTLALAEDVGLETETPEA